MDTTVSDINRKEMQEREEHQFAADFLRRRASSSSLSAATTTTGCFSRIRPPAADGADLNGEFQRSVRQAFAEARQAGIKIPLLCGAIPFVPGGLRRCLFRSRAAGSIAPIWPAFSRRQERASWLATGCRHGSRSWLWSAMLLTR